ncbi:hypothetical protein LA080_002006 [Diaporthe eres]|nr:hypothetical protein LA080_002006 [Diaporthe eres]
MPFQSTVQYASSHSKTCSCVITTAGKGTVSPLRIVMHPMVSHQNKETGYISEDLETLAKKTSGIVSLSSFSPDTLAQARVVLPRKTFFYREFVRILIGHLDWKRPFARILCMDLISCIGDGQEQDESAIVSSSLETGTSSIQSTNEETTLDASQPATNLSQSSELSEPELATQEPSEAVTSATSATGGELPEDEEVELDSAEARPFADFELGDRKIDGGDQPPASQLNYDDIAMVQEESQWLPGDFAELDHPTYDGINFTNAFVYGLSEWDFTLLNPLDDIEGAEDWLANLDLPGYE